MIKKHEKIFDMKKFSTLFLLPNNFSFLNHKIYIKDLYARLRLIDEGTYGKVFKARRFITSKIYACKEIRTECKIRLNFSTSLREVNLLLSIRHPNIIFAKEIKFGHYLEKIFIVMEYCEYDLKSILFSCVKFSIIQIKYIMRQLFRGISVLHENGILHRDLKTSNILLNNRGIVKICDFGLSRLHDCTGFGMTRQIVTLWYRAPEVLLGEILYKSSLDVWSIGCIFGELILNEVLFPGKSEIDQLSKIFCIMGTPNSNLWINLHKLSAAQKIKFPVQPYNNLGKKFNSFIDYKGLNLLQRLLTYDPDKRITSKAARNHPFFL